MKLKAPKEWKEVKGIFVGGCVKRGEGSSFRAKAHAHNFTIDPLFGWICVRSLKRIGIYVLNYDGQFDGEIITPSNLLWHEYSHILLPNRGHDKIWREKCKELNKQFNCKIAYSYTKRAKKS